MHHNAGYASNMLPVKQYPQCFVSGFVILWDSWLHIEFKNAIN